MLFPEKVKLTEETHKYYDENGEEYLSFSSIYEFLATPFDATKVAYFTGGKSEQGMNAKLEEWEKQRADGVRVDEALTHYLKHGEIRAEHKDIELDILQLGIIYPTVRYPQLTVYNTHYRTAGTADAVSLTSNRKDSSLIISDTKCYEKMEDDLYEGRGWLKAPFTHLPNSKYIKTSMQLSYYAYHVEALTGKRVKELFIHLIQPSTCKNGGNVVHKKIPVPYLRHDIEILLETFKDQIKSRLTNKNEFVI